MPDYQHLYSILFGETFRPWCLKTGSEVELQGPATQPAAARARELTGASAPRSLPRLLPLLLLLRFLSPLSPSRAP